MFCKRQKIEMKNFGTSKRHRLREPPAGKGPPGASYEAARDFKTWIKISVEF